MPSSNDTRDDEILLEIAVYGNTLRVCAMDASTLDEVVFQAPRSLGRHELGVMARQKLNQLAMRTLRNQPLGRNRA